MLKISDLCCEYKINPIGIDVQKPRLFWRLSSDERGALQSAYQIQVAASHKDLACGDKLIWDSGQIKSTDSIHIEYAGPALKSRERRYWRVRVWDEKGVESQWSEIAFLEMGLLCADDWQAAMIQPDLQEDPKKSEPCPLLRKEFNLKNDIVRARLYITVQGLYEAHINGRRVGDDLFTPGWTPYHSCLQYQTYDVTNLLIKGANAIGVTLADGWYRGYVSYTYDRNVYGDKLSLLAQLEITRADGTIERIISDHSWKCATGAVRSSDLFNGETFDSTKYLPGWDSPGFKDSSWQSVNPVAFDKSILTAQRSEAVRKVEEIKPVAILKTPKGETVIDFGQNMTGWVRLQARGARGTQVSVKHGEVLDQQGNFFDKNMRMAKSNDIYIMAGTGGDEVFEPHFTFHGFRYAKVEGYPGKLTVDCMNAVVIHSAIERTGDFSCSSDLVNKLYKNTVWSQRGNFLDVPTDCPQRDERMGWTGDIQVFTPTACLNMNSAAFLARWLRDLKLEQKKSGSVPMVIPNTFYDDRETFGRLVHHKVCKRKGDEKDFFDEFIAVFVLIHTAAWGDAAAIIPWHLYEVYGDKRVLEDQYESMRSLFKYHLKKSGGITSLLLMNPLKWMLPKTWQHLKYYYTANIGFGDWLAPGDDMDKSIFKSVFYIPTVYMALDALILAQTAEVIGRKDDATYYRSMYEKIREAYRYFKIEKDGKLKPHRQTAYVLALMADLIPEQDRAKAAGRLAELVRKDNYQLGTGFLGTPKICSILCAYGYVEEAYRLLLNEDHQWLYQVRKGATTIWEHWDSIKPDGSYQPSRMLSFNHYASGAICAWLYQDVAGINHDVKEPGYKKIIIRPIPGGGLKYAKGSYKSIHGLISSEWSIADSTFHLKIEIPANTTATVIIPEKYCSQISEGINPVTLRDGAINVGSGKYEFQCRG